MNGPESCRDFAQNHSPKTPNHGPNYLQGLKALGNHYEKCTITKNLPGNHWNKLSYSDRPDTAPVRPLASLLAAMTAPRPNLMATTTCNKEMAIGMPVMADARRPQTIESHHAPETGPTAR